MSETFPEASPTTVRRGAVVSDLHLFSPRSDGENLFRAFESTTGNDVDTLVLNGDTFDFRWSRLPSEAASIEAAIDWLRSLLGRQPSWEVHFVIGNHDCLAAFRSPLEQLADAHPRLHWHEHRLRLGDRLFLHGDCVNRRMGGEALARFRDSWSRDRQRGPAAARLYAGVDALGLSRRFHHLYFPHSRVTSRLVHHLDRVQPGWHDVISHCYLGHTHRPFADLHHRGVRFSNTGSAIRGMGFCPRTFSWTPSDH